MPAPTKKADTQALAAAQPETLADAILAFQMKLPRVGKTKTAKIEGSRANYSYKYADLSDVVDVVLPLLNGLGLTFICTPERNEDGSYSLVGVLTHAKSGESMRGSLPLKTTGSPQDLGSYITYERRYLLTVMTGVVAEEDDDAQFAKGSEDAAVQAQLEADRAQAEENVRRKRLQNSQNKAGARFKAMNPAADRAAFVAAVEQTFAQPYEDVTADQLDTFCNAPAGVTS